MHSQTWKNLERDVAAHFGVKRNIKRGADFGIEDTDVDVFPPESKLLPNGHSNEAFIIDCKHDQSAAALVRAFRDHAATSNGLIPVLHVYSGKRIYRVSRLNQFLTVGTGAIHASGYWIGSWEMRKGSKYLDEWMDKLNNVYKPMKAAEFSFPYVFIISLVAIRVNGVRETIIVQEIFQ